jgi:TolB-like protein
MPATGSAGRASCAHRIARPGQRSALGGSLRARPSYDVGMPIGLALALTLAAGPRVAVMPICAGEAISEKSVDSLTQVLAAELRQQSGAQVITARDLASLLSLEQQKQMLGCTTESCMAELAGAVGADRVVAGDVAKLEKSLVVQFRIIDAKKAAVVSQSHRRFKKGNFDDLLDALPAMVGELVGTAPAPGAAKPTGGKGDGGATAPTGKTVSSSAIPAGPLVLHYRREDGRYAGVELVMSDESTGSRPRGRKPDGTDDFGVFWEIPVGSSPDTRVTFAIRLPGGWDECTMSRKVGEPLVWKVAEGREVWQRVPGCALGARP